METDISSINNKISWKYLGSGNQSINISSIMSTFTELFIVAVRSAGGFVSSCHILKHQYNNIDTSFRSYGLTARVMQNTRYIICGVVHISGNNLNITEYYDGDGNNTPSTAKIHVYYKT